MNRDILAGGTYVTKIAPSCADYALNNIVVRVVFVSMISGLHHCVCLSGPYRGHVFWFRRKDLSIVCVFKRNGHAP